MTTSLREEACPSSRACWARRAPRGGRILLALALFGGLDTSAAAAASQLYGGFAEIDPSPRAVALGGNLCALAAGAEALGSNPAGLLNTDSREVSFAYADLFGLGLVSHSAAQFAWPLLGKDVRWERGEIRTVRRPPPAGRAIGIAVTNLSTGVEPDRYDETQLTIAYATRALGFSVGADYRFLWAQSNLENLGAQGHSIDFGLKRNWGGVSFALAARNLASGVNWARGLDEPLARRLLAGASLQVVPGLTAQATVDWVGDGLERRQASLGGEFRPVRVLTLRGAIRQREDAIERQSEWSAGAGFETWRLRLAYGISSHAQELGETQRWSGSFLF